MAATSPATDSFSPQQARFQLVVEEYKSLRDEIARFQNQQKQIITGGVAAIVGSLLTGPFKEINTRIADNPLLLLFFPLVFAPLSILFFETDLNVYIAAYYLAVELKGHAKEICGHLGGTLGWEDHRAKDPLVSSYPTSKWVLFLLPSGICVIAALSIQYLFFGLASFLEIRILYWLLLAADLYLIERYLRLFQQTNKAAARLRDKLNERD